MYSFEYKNINITPESKILIGLGDSFTEGQGACSFDVWEKYDWNFDKMYKFNPDPASSGNNEVLISEHEGSWVNQICKNHLTDFIPINFGLRGCGNRATVKELYLHPSLGIERAKEKIVVFMLTGMERFDFVNREYEKSHNHFYAMWPNPWDKTASNPKLWEIYAKDIWSDVFGVIEMLLNIAEVETWCKAHNASLIITSAFRTGINKDSVENILKERYVEYLADVIEWDKFLYPKGYECMTDMLVNLEERDDLLGGGFYAWAMSQNKLTPKKYFTKCAHPSVIGHKEIARVIYNRIIKNYSEDVVRYAVTPTPTPTASTLIQKKHLI